MDEVTLLAVAAVWLVLLGFGALVVRRELELLTDRVDSIGRTPMDGLAVGSFAPRVPGLGRDDVVLFLFGDCSSCHEVIDAVRHSLLPELFLCVVNDGTVPGSGDSVVASLPAGVRRVTGADARGALERFQVHSAPFGVALVDGIVAAKGTLHETGELDRLAKIVNRRRQLPLIDAPDAGHRHDHEHEPAQ
ncbi:hypothetical protein [Micromonospora sp. NPDC005189]|uniref:hypothetical protein n=1 Tax=unclassified Micromonospora TaxID=2617518 RepID=UPI00339E1EE7